MADDRERSGQDYEKQVQNINENAGSKGHQSAEKRRVSSYRKYLVKHPGVPSNAKVSGKRVSKLCSCRAGIHKVKDFKRKCEACIRCKHEK